MRRIYTGIDLGSYGIKIVVSELIHGKFQILASANVRSKGIKNGLIIDMNDASLSLLEAKKKIEGMLGIKVDQAIVTVPSDGMKFDIVSSEVFLEKDHLIDASNITFAFQEAILGHVPDDMELVTIMPISFHIDGGEGIKDPKGMVGEKLGVKAVITTIPKLFLKQAIALLKQCEIETVDVGFSGLGDYFEARNRHLDHEVVATINFGYDKTEVAIFNKGIMIKNEKIEAGSKQIDVNLAKAFQIKKGTARYLKESFAVSNTRYSDVNDVLDVGNRQGEIITLNQLEVSEIVEAQVVELLKLAKKQINILTNREISYIIITGGISELAGFQYVVENVFDRRASTLNIGTMGVRNNVYSSALGLIKYFHYKLELRGTLYSMFSERQADDLISTKKKIAGGTNESIISKVFGYFSGD